MICAFSSASKPGERALTETYKMYISKPSPGVFKKAALHLEHTKFSEPVATNQSQPAFMVRHVQHRAF